MNRIKCRRNIENGTEILIKLGNKHKQDTNLSENSVIDTIRRHFDILLYFSILSSNLCETLQGR